MSLFAARAASRIRTARPTRGTGRPGAAHRRDMPVSIPVNREQVQPFAVAAGVDAIALGVWRNMGRCQGYSALRVGSGSKVTRMRSNFTRRFG